MEKSGKEIIERKIVAGVVANEGKILIIQRSSKEWLYPNLWELPSGKKEPLEPTEKAIIREVKEETGLNVSIIKVFSVFDYQIGKENEIRDATQINFLVEPRGNIDVVLSPEHQNFAWIGEDEINKYDLTEQTQRVIKQGFE